ncbi:MAG: hypothetical protein ISP90_02860 [Nevskia sp.]|nr:hypothetical protein [Nevskia sp.]
MGLTVTAATRRAAILKTMADLHSLKVGERLPVTRLMAVWAPLGLRADDLTDGLNECIADGILDFSADAQEFTVWLSDAGKTWIDAVHAQDDIATQKRILHAAEQRRIAQAGHPEPFLRERRKG